MTKLKSFILCLLFPIMVYGKGSMRDTVRIQVHKQTYELTMLIFLISEIAVIFKSLINLR